MLIRNPVFAKHLNLLTSVIRTDAATNDSYLITLNLTGRTRGALYLWIVRFSIPVVCQ